MRQGQNYRVYAAISVSLVTLIVYLPSIQNGFVEWDDYTYVVENYRIHSLNLTLLKWAFLQFYAANWHPLTWISHALDYAVWGLNPLGHHLTNIILHSANTFVVVLLITRLIDALKRREQETVPSDFLNERSTSIMAGITGLLFGLHPLHVESVAWVAERKDLLCALFYLLSITAYAKYRSSVRNKAAQANYLSRFTNKHFTLAFILFALALLSKPMAVTLPAVLLILDWYPFFIINSFKTFRSSLCEKFPFIALSFVSIILTLLAQNAGGALASIETIPFSTRAFVAAQSLIAYLGKMVLPLRLSPYYPYPEKVVFFSPKYFVPIVLVFVITIACVVIAKKQRLWLAVWAYYLSTLAPVIGIVQVGSQAMANRYLYLPSLGPFIVVSVVLARFAGKIDADVKPYPIARLATHSAFIFIIVFMSYATYKQIGIWKDSFTLWDHVIDMYPRTVPLSYNNRGLAYERVGQFEKAAEDYKTAIDVDQSYWKAYNNLGKLYCETGMFEKSIEYLNKAIAINANYFESYNNLGVAYALINQYGPALENFKLAIELDRTRPDVYFNRANLYINLERRQLAEADFQKACELGDTRSCNALRR